MSTRTTNIIIDWREQKNSFKKDCHTDLYSINGLVFASRKPPYIVRQSGEK